MNLGKPVRDQLENQLENQLYSQLGAQLRVVSQELLQKE